MKLLRAAIGVLAVIVAIWIIVGEQMAGASANAVVNAPVVTLRASTAGVLRLADRSIGARVEADEVLGEIANPLVDRVRLNDLMLEVALAKAETARSEADLAATQAMIEELDARTGQFHASRLEEIRTRLQHARQRLEILRGGDLPDRADQRLVDAIDLQDYNDLPAEPRVPALVLDHAIERVRLLEIALEAAEAGVFLGDGYNDSPNAGQRATELRSVAASLEAQLTGNKAREEAYAKRLSREQVRVTGETGGALTAPVSGRYWEVLEADGVTVQRGDPVLRLVDCGAAFVTLSVTERIYNRLQVGDTAQFRLMGDRRIYQGTVTRLAGSGAATVYNHLAVAPSGKHLERFDVALSVPDLNDDPSRACAIGRTGRAFFETRPLDRLRDLF